MAYGNRSFKCTVAAFAVACAVSAPALAQDGDLDGLFAQLADATEETHEEVANRIVSVWERSGSAAMDLLLRRGREAMEEGDLVAAVEHYSALVDHAPDFAEGYHARAAAYFGQDRLGLALDDLRQVLVLEPRHFEAMYGVAVILEQLGRPEDAMEVYGHILKIYPLDAEAMAAVERLTPELQGQAL